MASSITCCAKILIITASILLAYGIISISVAVPYYESLNIQKTNCTVVACVKYGIIILMTYNGQNYTGESAETCYTGEPYIQYIFPGDIKTCYFQLENIQETLTVFDMIFVYHAYLLPSSVLCIMGAMLIFAYIIYYRVKYQNYIEF